MKSNETGFTGLEAAIVLIAFIVVAAVFSYVILGAGFFTTQTAQATIHTGVAQASSSIEVVGNVIGTSIDPTAASPRLTFVNISVALMAGGTAMDLSQMVISYSDVAGGRNPNIPNSTSGINDCITDSILTVDHDFDGIKWCVSQKMNDRNPGFENNLLEANEIWILSIGTPATAGINQKITITLQPSVGSVLPVMRTIPGGLSRIQAIY